MGQHMHRYLASGIETCKTLGAKARESEHGEKNGNYGTTPGAANA
jgi:hypothetical protein